MLRFPALLREVVRLSEVGSNSLVNHPVLGMGTITGVRELGPFPDGQVASTIAVMRRRVQEDRFNPAFQAHAYRVLDRAGDLVTGAFEHTRRAISFLQDKQLAEMAGVNPDNVVEFVVRPREMAQLVDSGRAAGDCDDFVMYCSALLECHGVPTSFITVGADESAPDQFSHVYLRCYPYEGGRKGLSVALDPSHGPYAGWEVPDVFGKWQEWPVDGGLLWAGVSAELLAASLFIGFVIWWAFK